MVKKNPQRPVQQIRTSLCQRRLSTEDFENRNTEAALQHANHQLATKTEGTDYSFPKSKRSCGVLEKGVLDRRDQDETVSETQMARRKCGDQTEVSKSQSLAAPLLNMVVGVLWFGHVWLPQVRTHLNDFNLKSGMCTQAWTTLFKNLLELISSHFPAFCLQPSCIYVVRLKNYRQTFRLE